MKKICLVFWIVSWVIGSAFAMPINECKIDIYFGNGVWNTVEDAEKSRKVLENFVIKKEVIKNDPTLAAKYGKVKLAYNWSDGWDIDLVETFYQLKEAGQLSEKTFFVLMDELITKRAADLYGEDLKTMRNLLLQAITSHEQANVDIMLEKYYNESFRYSHRVLLVSHSQGNLFANRVYDSIDPAGYKDYFANVQVASPASSVHAAKGTYITGWVDPIINPIPGSMKHNATLDGIGGHAFVAAYLDSKDTYQKIVKAIKEELAALDDPSRTPSQWKIVKEPSRCGSCSSFTVTIQHKFDSALYIDERVLPYRIEGYKLYPIDWRYKDGTSGHYVLARCGGTRFKDLENDDESPLCSRLEGIGEGIPKMHSILKGVCIGIIDSDIAYRFDKQRGELLIGTIGDNYWRGSCTSYYRSITLMIENLDNLQSFNIYEVGFDDWILLSANGKKFYRSPYTLPSDCELSTSFIENSSIEIKPLLKEGINHLDMHVIVTGGGEGWFKARLR